MSSQAEREGRTAGQRVLRSTIIQWVAKLGTAAVTLATVSVLARAIGPDDYGKLGLIGVYVSVVAVLLEFGLPLLLAREVSKAPDRAPELVSAVLWGRLALAPVFYLTGLGLAFLLYGRDDVLLIGIAISLLGLLPGAVSSSLASVYQQQIRLGPLAWLELVTRAINFLLVLLLLEQGGGVRAVVAVGLFLSFAQMAGSIALLDMNRRALWGRPDWPLFRRMLSVSAGLGAATVLNTLYVRFDTVLISLLRSAGDVGLYVVAYRSMEMVLLLPSLFASALLPMLSTAAGVKEDLARLYDGGLRFVLLVVSPFVAAFVVLAQPITTVLGGDAFRASGASLQALSLATLASAVNILLGLVIIALDKQARAIWLNITALALNVVLNVLLVPRFGGVGAAWATSVSEVYVLVFAARLVRAQLGSWPRLGYAPRVALAAVLAAGVGRALRDQALPLSFGLLVTGFCASLAVLRVVGPGDIAFLRVALRRAPAPDLT